LFNGKNFLIKSTTKMPPKIVRELIEAAKGKVTAYARIDGRD